MLTLPSNGFLKVTHTSQIMYLYHGILDAPYKNY